MSAYKDPCHYCNGKVEKTLGKDVYPRSPTFAEIVIYKCTNCNAYVGSHRTTGLPLGIVANDRLRDLRGKCHNIFDKLWVGRDQRNEEYAKLAEKLGIPREDCHFAMFDEDLCIKALAILRGEREKPVRKQVFTRKVRNESKAVVKAVNERPYRHFPKHNLRDIIEKSTLGPHVKENIARELILRELDELF